MEYPRFLDCLAADFARLRAVVPIEPTAAVPICPGWTVADLSRLDRGRPVPAGPWPT
jgi:hypothetical protein